MELLWQLGERLTSNKNRDWTTDKQQIKTQSFMQRFASSFLYQILKKYVIIFTAKDKQKCKKILSVSQNSSGRKIYIQNETI